MLDIYHDIVERLLNPPMPQFQNTDGDPLLPHRLVYEIESLQAMLAQMENVGETASSRPHQNEPDDLNNDPEVKAHLTEYLRQHYRNWPQEKLPALNGKTPLQAVKTRDGREMV